MTTDIQDQLKQVLKSMDDIRDNNIIRGKEYDHKFLLEVGELIRSINNQTSLINTLKLRLDIARDRGDDYMTQAIRNNKKYEEAKSTISKLESGKEEDQLEFNNAKLLNAKLLKTNSSSSDTPMIDSSRKHFAEDKDDVSDDDDDPFDDDDDDDDYDDDCEDDFCDNWRRR